MINAPSPRNSNGGFHADPVVIIHSSEVNGHTRRQKFIILTLVGTMVLSALIIGSVLLAKSLTSKSAKGSTSKMESTSRYVVTFDPAIDIQQISILVEILKSSNQNVQISDTFNGGIFLEGHSALDDAKFIYKVAIDMGLSAFYTIANVYSGDVLFRHCTNSQDERCSSNESYIMAPEEQKSTDVDNYTSATRDADCPPGFQGPDCVDCAQGRYGPQCEFECGDCGRGVCFDGIRGDGHCICPEGFGGNCMECLPGRYGPDCLGQCACKKEWGMCDDGLNGTGQCTCINNHIVGDLCDRCDVGWAGADCTLAEGNVGLNAFNYCGERPDLIAVTFDGWPSNQILEELEITKLKATFFIRPGLASNTSCALVQDALQRGHGIQLGGFNGESMEAMTAQQIDLQLDASLFWLQECVGSQMISEIVQLRPPLEKFDNGRARYVSERGFAIATWNIDGNVGFDFFKLFDEFRSIGANSSILIRFDASSYNQQLLVLASFFESFRPEINKRFVVTTDCYIACTGGNGVCRSDKGPGVFDTFQTITSY